MEARPASDVDDINDIVTNDIDIGDINYMDISNI